MTSKITEVPTENFKAFADDIAHALTYNARSGRQKTANCKLSSIVRIFEFCRCSDVLCPGSLAEIAPSSLYAAPTTQFITQAQCRRGTHEQLDRASLTSALL